ncbi:unnamed protein product [Ceratitis capitata]|uniref:(Mediterranean fruit fly) hypothetical protein n=1 Tax=Ceratitis capitata TaxID=7213 RepID=A0A811V9P0_CERCA|nr:unnamed protein product [Ceratitis capitata]
MIKQQRIKELFATMSANFTKEKPPSAHRRKRNPNTHKTNCEDCTTSEVNVHNILHACAHTNMHTYSSPMVPTCSECPATYIEVTMTFALQRHKAVAALYAPLLGCKQNKQANKPLAEQCRAYAGTIIADSHIATYVHTYIQTHANVHVQSEIHTQKGSRNYCLRPNCKFVCALLRFIAFGQCCVVHIRFYMRALLYSALLYSSFNSNSEKVFLRAYLLTCIHTRTYIMYICMYECVRVPIVAVS